MSKGRLKGFVLIDDIDIDETWERLAAACCSRIFLLKRISKESNTNNQRVDSLLEGLKQMSSDMTNRVDVSKRLLSKNKGARK
jgi:hypothetical protein